MSSLLPFPKAQLNLEGREQVSVCLAAPVCSAGAGTSGSSGYQQDSLALASSGVLLHGLALAQEDKARSCSRLCCGGLGPRVGLGVKDRADWMWA